LGYRLTPDPAALADALSSAAMESVCRRAAERVKEYAVEFSPVVTGLYKSSWYVLSGHGTGGTAWARVANDVHYAWYVEHGNSRGAPAQHILRRAGEAYAHE
jgi:hypothetical protein